MSVGIRKAFSYVSFSAKYLYLFFILNAWNYYDGEAERLILLNGKTGFV